MLGLKFAPTAAGASKELQLLLGSAMMVRLMCGDRAKEAPSYYYLLPERYAIVVYRIAWLMPFLPVLEDVGLPPKPSVMVL